MQTLSLGNHKFDDHGSIHFAKCIPKVEELRLYDCNIGERVVEVLSQTITTRKQPVNIIQIILLFGSFIIFFYLHCY